MNVLIACEESQEVCNAFRARGHEAYSCDIQECSGGHPEWHIMGDVLQYINGYCDFTTMGGVRVTIDSEWDLVIAHPPCTDLAVSGARWFPEKQRDFRQQKSCVFFMQMMLNSAKRVAVENPIGIMSNCYRKPDQIIQPYEYGDPHRKATCLWLKNLPPLVPTKIVEPAIVAYTRNDGRITTFDVDYIASGKDRAKKRSKTYHGIALAMAEQWG